MINPLAECNAWSNETTRPTTGGDSGSRGSSSGRLPLIAMLVRVSTHNVYKPSLVDLDVFTVSLPSLMSSLDCGFRYLFFLGYDVGDPYFDSNKVSCRITVLVNSVCLYESKSEEEKELNICCD